LVEKKNLIDTVFKGINDRSGQLISFIQRRFQHLFIGTPAKERQATEINLRIRAIKQQKYDRSRDLKLVNGNISEFNHLKRLSVYEYHELLEYLNSKK
jgi:hypothetical protein